MIPVAVFPGLKGASSPDESRSLSIPEACREWFRPTKVVVPNCSSSLPLSWLKLRPAPLLPPMVTSSVFWLLSYLLVVSRNDDPNCRDTLTRRGRSVGRQTLMRPTATSTTHQVQAVASVPEARVSHKTSNMSECYHKGFHLQVVSAISNCMIVVKR